MKAVKIRAVNEGRRLKDVVAELIRRGLAYESEPLVATRTRVVLPLVHCAHRARPEEEMTPTRTAAILLQDEVAGTTRSS